MKVALVITWLFSIFLLPALRKQPEATPARMRIESVAPAPSQLLAQEKAVLFYDDFDQPADPASRYFEYDRSGGSFVRSEGEGYGGQGAAMRCRFEKGQVAAGSLKLLFGKNPFGRGIRTDETFREIYWRVYIRHQPGWEGNPAKLARATCLAGTDWSQGFIAHVWGGKGDVLCIDPASGIRDSHKVTQRYNDFDHLRWLGLQNGKTPVFSPAESGRWVCIESHIRLNSPGQKDGVFELWIDGKREAARTDLDWHGNWNDYAINAVFLENYWNEGSIKPQVRWFDNFVISTRPIGPIIAADPPSVTRTAGQVAAWEVQAASDPEGNEVVWSSQSVVGTGTHLTLDAAHGTFRGNLATVRRLIPGTTYWLRLRERDAFGIWSAWTAWHSPFRAAP